MTSMAFLLSTSCGMFVFRHSAKLGKPLRGSRFRSLRFINSSPWGLYFGQQLSAGLAHTFEHLVAARHCRCAALFNKRSLLIRAFDLLQLYQLTFGTGLLIELRETNRCQRIRYFDAGLF